jgi:HAD superfamily hydrolase (TIGR01509 family)
VDKRLAVLWLLRYNQCQKGGMLMGYKIYGKKTLPIKGVLFDMDGVVLDTEKLYARFWAEAAHALGYPMTYEQALGMRSLNSQAGQQKLESYFGPGVSRAVMRDKRVELMDAFVAENGIDPKPGIHELLDALKERGIKTAIATSSPMDRATAYLSRLGLLEKFDCICSGHEVKQGKPAPDIYLYAAASIGVAPENCLAIEDSPAGIESAYRAGCMPVLVPDLDGSTEEMRKILFAEADCLTDLINMAK